MVAPGRVISHGGLHPGGRMTVRLRPSFLPLAALAGVASIAIAVSGCGGSKNHNRPLGSGAAPTSSSSTTATTLAYSSVALTSTTSLLGQTIPVHVFRLTNPGTVDATLTSLTVRASGTVNEVAFIQSASLIVDTNQNAVIDAGETQVASIGSAWTTNDGNVTFSPTGLTIPSNGGRQLIVAAQLVPITGTAAQAAVVGSTVIVGIDAASAFTVTSSQGSPSVGGTFPSNGATITLGIGPHLLITEVVTGPGDAMGVVAEFIEIFNPTPSTVLLTNHYLTDFTIQPTTSPPTQAYYRITQGNNFSPATPQTDVNAQDFVVRFPPGSSIVPGGIIIVAVDGVGYRAAYPAPAPGPTFCLKNAGASGANQMLTWNGTATTTTPPVFTQASMASPRAQLTDGGEQLWLYTWNQVSDLIVDVDMVLWGVASAANTSIAKSGLAIDGIDAGTTTTTYVADTAENLQENVRATATGAASIQRVDFTESTESKAGPGNGEGGHNETSENWRTAFTSGATSTATPGRLQ